MQNFEMSLSGVFVTFFSPFLSFKERKQVARKSYADPHKRQKVIHSGNGEKCSPEKEKAPAPDVISIDEDTNEEITKPKSPEQEKSATVIEIDDDEDANKEVTATVESKTSKSSSPISEIAPPVSSTNDVSEINDVDEPAAAAVVSEISEPPVENGDIHETAVVVPDVEETPEGQTAPDSTTTNTTVAEEEPPAKITEDPPTVTEEAKAD